MRISPKLKQFKHSAFQVVGVISLVWWFFILYTVLSYLVVGCLGFQCSLQRFTEKVLTDLYTVTFILAIPSGFYLYKKILVKRPAIMKVVFVLSILLLFYVLFFNI